MKNGNDEKMTTDKIKPGQPRDWAAEPESVQKTFEYIITLVVDQLIKADMQNLGITAQAADAGRLEVTGMLPRHDR